MMLAPHIALTRIHSYKELAATYNVPMQFGSRDETRKSQYDLIWLIFAAYDNDFAGITLIVLICIFELGINPHRLDVSAKIERRCVGSLAVIEDGKSQMAHVGNSMRADIAGGNKYGVTTCLVRRAGTYHIHTLLPSPATLSSTGPLLQSAPILVPYKPPHMIPLQVSLS